MSEVPLPVLTDGSTRAVGVGRPIFGEGAPGAPGSPTDILGMPVFDDLAVGFEPVGDDITGSDVGVDKVVWEGTVEDNGEIMKESSQTPF